MTDLHAYQMPQNANIATVCAEYVISVNLHSQKTCHPIVTIILMPQVLDRGSGAEHILGVVGNVWPIVLFQI